jgi:hypothetical protein
LILKRYAAKLRLRASFVISVGLFASNMYQICTSINLLIIDILLVTCVTQMFQQSLA